VVLGTRVWLDKEGVTDIRSRIRADAEKAVTGGTSATAGPRNGETRGFFFWPGGDKLYRADGGRVGN
jgi:hypothetical protein